jgi:hypothetical protein
MFCMNRTLNGNESTIEQPVDTNCMHRDWLLELLLLLLAQYSEYDPNLTAPPPTGVTHRRNE